MKQPWEWVEADLIALIADGVKESVELDYKNCPALAKTDGKKSEVSKDVSALANSAGGSIVYGMMENGHVPTALDAGYDPLDISKEWLEQVINGNIQPRIDGVRINQVELVTHNPGKVAYVVYVPQSTRAPHQAADKRYYKRYNFESVPMEDYEVRDVSRRLATPDLQVLFDANVLNTTHPDPARNPEWAEIDIGGFITNRSPAPAHYAIITLFVDDRLAIPKLSSFIDHGKHPYTVAGQQYLCTRLVHNWSVPPAMPLFAGVRFALEKSLLLVQVLSAGSYLLAWNVRAPSMSMKGADVWLVWDGKTARIEPAQP